MAETAGYLGVDIGSISTNIVLIDQEAHMNYSLYKRSQGSPIISVQEGLAALCDQIGTIPYISGVGVTGSARNLIGTIIGADIIKNEITAHGLAAIHLRRDIRTVIEIGGQDSKIIIIRNGIISDFGMNTVCAAGTGSFLDQQANRLGIPIEEFGSYALKASEISPIAGRCTVFAESDMIHKQQMGYDKPAIIAGLCDALVHNFLNNVAKGKDIVSPVFFQGGVAANVGIKVAFERILSQKILIPPFFNVMGAYGAAILAMEKFQNEPKRESQFRGFDLSMDQISTQGFLCGDCTNNCEIIKIFRDGKLFAYSGDRCGKFSEQTCTESDVSSDKVCDSCFDDH